MLSFNLLWQTPLWTALANHPKVHPSPCSSQFLWQQHWGQHNWGGPHLHQHHLSWHLEPGQGAWVLSTLQELSFDESCLRAEILKITIDVFGHDSSHTKEVPRISPYLLCCGCQYRNLPKLSHYLGGGGSHADLKCDKIMQRKSFHWFLAHYQRTKSCPLSLLIHGTRVVWSLRCFMISGFCELYKPKISKCWVICLLMPGSFVAPFPRHSLQKQHKYTVPELF